MGEDTIVAAKMIIKGWNIAYVADAMVFHSHSYSFMQEYKRYFDTGVFHKQNEWLYEYFGKPAGEGVRFVLSECRFVLKRNFLLLFVIPIKTICKWMGYKRGYNYQKLSLDKIKKMSMHKRYWEKK